MFDQAFGYRLHFEQYLRYRVRCELFMQGVVTLEESQKVHVSTKLMSDYKGLNFTNQQMTEMVKATTDRVRAEPITFI